MTDLRKAAEMALEALEKYSGVDQRACDAEEALQQALAQPEQEQPKHWSDCAVYNEPAYPKGECDCGGFDPNNKWHGLTEEEAEKIAFDVIADGVSKILAQPEQRPVGTYEGVMETMLSLRKGTLEQQQIYTHMKDKLLYTAPPSLEAAVLAEREACAKFVDHILREGGGTYGDAIRARLAQPDDFVYNEDKSFRLGPSTGSFGIGDAPEKKPEQEPVAWMNNDYEVFFDAGKAACYSMGWIKPLYTAPPKREWVGLTDEDKHFLLATAWNKEQAFDGFMDAIDKFLKEKNT